MVLTILTLINLGLILILFLAETLVAESSWLTALLVYLPQQIYLIPTLIFLIWALARKSWKMLALNAAVGIFMLFTLLGFNIPWHRYTVPRGTGPNQSSAATASPAPTNSAGSPTPAISAAAPAASPAPTISAASLAPTNSPAIPGPALTVMTYNVDIKSFSENTALVVQTVRRVNPDILCLQEVSPPFAGIPGAPVYPPLQGPDPLMKLQAVLANHPGETGAGTLPRGSGGLYLVRQKELAILSRYPIISHQFRYMPAPVGRAILLATIDVNGTTLNVFNTHLNTALYGESLRRHTTTLNTYLWRTGAVRLLQANALLEWARSVPGLKLICGDFNTPPRGKVYQKMTHGFRDSFRQAGWGFGYTYNSELPMMRIDYIYVSPEIRVNQALVLNTRASDHLPMTARLVLPAPLLPKSP